MGLEGRRIAITGGSRGIGQRIAHHLVEAGAEVALFARDTGDLESAADGLTRGAQRPLTFAGDVTDTTEVSAFVATLQDRWGSLDGLVNNAGTYPTGRFEDIPLERWWGAYATNVIGPVDLTRQALPLLRRAERGRIVNVASTAGRWGSLDQSPYNASKHAMLGWTRCLALELADGDIRINAVCPGAIDTDLLRRQLEHLGTVRGETTADVAARFRARIPTGDFSSPEDVAAVTGLLLDPAVTSITGQSYGVDGGVLLL